MDSQDDLAVARALVRGMAFEDLRPEAMEFLRRVVAGEGLVRHKDGSLGPVPARTRLKATAMVLDRTDPVPRASVNVLATGPVQLTWETPSRSSLPPPRNGTSTNGSNGSPSSSATGDSGKPSWL